MPFFIFVRRQQRARGEWYREIGGGVLKRPGSLSRYRYADAVRVNVNHLSDVTLPAIAHMSDGHYVVLYQFVAELVIVGDPANGIHKINRNELHRIWPGHLILIRLAKLPLK